VVIFFHWWLPSPPDAYAEWLRHLAHQGDTILYPVYQARETKPEQFLRNAMAGIAHVFHRLHSAPNSVVALGFNTGGPLAFGYAALAGQNALPEPCAAIAIFPGRKPGNGIVSAGDLSHIPASTVLTAITSTANPIPDAMSEARLLLEGASHVPRSHRHLLRAADPSPNGPFEANVQARRSFWLPVDHLISRTCRPSK
jgi:hypothetical protein